MLRQSVIFSLARDIFFQYPGIVFGFLMSIFACFLTLPAASSGPIKATDQIPQGERRLSVYRWDAYNRPGIAAVCKVRRYRYD